MISRRNLFAGAGGGLLARPFAAFTQQSRGMRRVGVLSPGAAMGEATPFGKAVLHALAENGFIVGKNLTYTALGAEGHVERLPELVAALAEGQSEVIITTGYRAAAAAKEKTTLPIVAINSGDPIATGLVQSLAHPGGNMTGISDVSAELTPKRLELLKEMAPGLGRVAVLWNADDLGMTLRYRAAEAGAGKLGIAVQAHGVREPDDFGQAFAAMEQQSPDAILMVTDVLTMLNRRPVFDFALKHRLPAMYEFASIVRDGGLMSYGPE